MIIKYSNDFDSNLVKILEKIVCDSDLVEELECAENIEDIYKICQKLGYNQNISEFEKQLWEIINYVQEVSDENLEKVSGGKDNLQKTCAILLTAINVGAPVIGATGDPNNHVSVQKQKSNIVSNKTESNFKEKFGSFMDKTNNYIRRGFKQIGEFAKNNSKTTAGISVVSAAFVPGFVAVANKVSSLMENSRNINEALEQQARLLFSKLTEIFNNIKNNAEKYYEKIENNDKLQIIKTNNCINNFITHAKNVGFNIESNIFDLKNNESLDFTNIISKLKNSTGDKKLQGLVDKLLSENGEVVKNIKTIEGKFISERVNEFVNKNEEKKRRKAKAKEDCKEFIKLADTDPEQFLKEYDSKYGEFKQELEGTAKWSDLKEKLEDNRKKVQKQQDDKKEQQEQARQQKDKNKARSALNTLRDQYVRKASGLFSSEVIYNFLAYLIDCVIKGKIEKSFIGTYTPGVLGDKYIGNYIQTVQALPVGNLLIFSKGVIRSTLVGKGKSSSYLEDVLKIALLANKLHPGSFDETAAVHEADDKDAQLYNEKLKKAKSDVESLLK